MIACTLCQVSMAGFRAAKKLWTGHVTDAEKDQAGNVSLTYQPKYFDLVALTASGDAGRPVIRWVAGARGAEGDASCPDQRLGDCHNGQS